MSKIIKNFELLKNKFLNINNSLEDSKSKELLKHDAVYAVVNKYDGTLMFSGKMNIIDLSTMSDDNFVISLLNQSEDDIDCKYIDYYKWVLLVYSLEKDFTIILRLMEEGITIIKGDPFDIKMVKEYEFYEDSE